MKFIWAFNFSVTWHHFRIHFILCSVAFLLIGLLLEAALLIKTSFSLFLYDTSINYNDNNIQAMIIISKFQPYLHRCIITSEGIHICILFHIRIFVDTIANKIEVNNKSCLLMCIIIYIVQHPSVNQPFDLFGSLNYVW